MLWHSTPSLAIVSTWQAPHVLLLSAAGIEYIKASAGDAGWPHVGIGSRQALQEHDRALGWWSFRSKSRVSQGCLLHSLLCKRSTCLILICPAVMYVLTRLSIHLLGRHMRLGMSRAAKCVYCVAWWENCLIKQKLRQSDLTVGDAVFLLPPSAKWQISAKCGQASYNPVVCLSSFSVQAHCWHSTHILSHKHTPRYTFVLQERDIPSERFCKWRSSYVQYAVA